jgi:hypothetical protein
MFATSRAIGRPHKVPYAHPSGETERNLTTKVRFDAERQNEVLAGLAITARPKGSTQSQKNIELYFERRLFRAWHLLLLYTVPVSYRP